MRIVGSSARPLPPPEGPAKLLDPKQQSAGASRRVILPAGELGVSVGWGGGFCHSMVVSPLCAIHADLHRAPTTRHPRVIPDLFLPHPPLSFILFLLLRFFLFGNVVCPGRVPGTGPEGGTRGGVRIESFARPPARGLG